MKRQEKIEARLLEMPLYDYAFFPVKDIIFTQDVRTICAMNDCGMYGRRWVCPRSSAALRTALPSARPMSTPFSSRP